MNVRRACLSILVLTLFGVPAVLGQGGIPPGEQSLSGLPESPGVSEVPGAPIHEGSPIPPGTPGASLVEGSGRPPTGLSSWITHGRACCCDSLGGIPIKNELYLRTGVSVPFGRSIGNELDPGWEIAGGVRLLLFDPQATNAWVFDVGLSNTAQTSTSTYRHRLHNIIVPGPVVFGTSRAVRLRNLDVTIDSLNRTFFNFGVGKEWYLSGSAADENHSAWRVGADFGGRWGTAKMEFNELRHRTDVIHGIYAAFHTDWEFLWKCYMFSLGGRVECDYTWMGILQHQNDANFYGVNLLATLGMRF